MVTIAPGEERTVPVGRFDELIVLDVSGIDVERSGTDALSLHAGGRGGRAVLMLRDGDQYRTVLVRIGTDALAISDRGERQRSPFDPKVRLAGNYNLIGGSDRTTALITSHEAEWSQAFGDTQVRAEVGVLQQGRDIGARTLHLGVDRPGWRGVIGDTGLILLRGFRGLTTAHADLRGVDFEVGHDTQPLKAFGTVGAHRSVVCCDYFDPDRLLLAGTGLTYDPSGAWFGSVVAGVMRNSEGTVPFSSAAAGYEAGPYRADVQLAQSGLGIAATTHAAAKTEQTSGRVNLGVRSRGFEQPLGGTSDLELAMDLLGTWAPMPSIRFEVTGFSQLRDRLPPAGDSSRTGGSVAARYAPWDPLALSAVYRRTLTVQAGDSQWLDAGGLGIAAFPSERLALGASGTLQSTDGTLAQLTADASIRGVLAEGWSAGANYRLAGVPGTSLLHWLRADSTAATDSIRGRIEIGARRRTFADNPSAWQLTGGASVRWRFRRLLGLSAGASVVTPVSTERVTWAVYGGWTLYPGALASGSAPFGFRGGARGIVFLDEDGDGVRDPEEQGVEGMELALDGSRSLATDADGAFVVRGLPVGDHVVHLDREAMQSVDGVDRSFDVQPFRKEVLEFAVTWGGRIRGMIYSDLDRDGEYQRDEPGVLATRVIVRDASGVVRGTEVARGGRFVFSGLPEGEYAISVDPLSLPEGFSAAEGLERRLFVREGRPVDVEIGLRAERAIAGVVWHDLDRNGTGGTAGDVGLGAVEVHLSNGLVTRTGPDGGYLFRDLDPGGYAVTTEITMDTRVVLLNVTPTQALDVDFTIPANVAPPDRTVEGPRPRPADFVAGLVLDAPVTVLPSGIRLQVTATAILSNGELRQVTSQADWSTSDASVLDVSDNGVVEGMAPGTAGVSATWREGLADPLTFEVLDPKLREVRLSPVGLRLNPGDMADLRVDAVDRAGRGGEVTPIVSWRVRDPEIAIVDEQGRLLALSEGSTQVEARVGEDWSAPIPVDVVVATVTGISIDGAPARMPEGATAILRASGYDTRLQVRDVTDEVVWETSDPAVIVVDPTGHLTAVGRGRARVTASIGSIIARSRTVSVTNTPPEALEIQPESLQVSLGERGRLRAYARFEDGRRGPVTTVVQWNVAGAAASVGSDGTVVPLRPGEVIVTAEYLGVTTEPVTVRVVP